MSLSPRRIAVLRALQLGDMLVAVPALRSVRTGFPDAEITLIGLPWARTFQQRFDRYLDRFVEFGGYPGLHELPLERDRAERFLREQREYGYDLVIQMHGSGRASTPLALALGGRITAGYYTGPRPSGLTIGERYPDHGPEIVRNLRLAELLGCRNLGTNLEFPLFPGDVSEAERLLAPFAGTGPLIGVHAGARPPSRRWMPQRFATVAEALSERYRARIVLTGGPDERLIARAVVEHLSAPALSLAGRTSLGGLGAVIGRLSLFISNDTGPAHIAVATSTPSVTIWGPSDPERWAPLDPARHRIVRDPVPCDPACATNCVAGKRCLLAVEPEAVLTVAESLLTQVDAWTA